MKRFGILMALFCFWLIPSLSAFSAEKPISLKYHFKANDSFTVYFLKNKQVHYDSVQGEKTDHDQTEVKRHFTVQKVNSDGSAQIEVVCDYISVKSLDANGEVTSVLDTRQDSPLEKATAAFMTKPLRVTVTSAGEITHIAGLQEALDSLYTDTESAVPDPAERHILGMVLDTVYGEHNVREILTRFIFIPYPNHPVAVGDSWEHPHEVTNDMLHLKATLRFTLSAPPQNNKVMLSFDDTVNVAESKSDLIVFKVEQGQSAGTYEMSADTGYIQQASFNTEDTVSSYQRVNGTEEWRITRKGNLQEKACSVKPGEPLPKAFSDEMAMMQAKAMPKGPPEEALNTVDDYRKQLRNHLKRNDLKKMEVTLDGMLRKFDLNKMSSEDKLGTQFLQSLVYTKLGRYEEAEKLFDAYMPLLEKTTPPPPLEILTTARSLQAETLMALKKWDRCEALLQKAVTALDTKPIAHPGKLGEALHNLGYFYQQQGQYAKAEALYNRSLKIAQESEQSPLSAAASYGNLCQVQTLANNLAAAEKNCKAAVLIFEKQLAPDHPNVAMSLKSLGIVYSQEGHKQEALETFNKGLAILEPAYQFMKVYYGQTNPDVVKIKAAISELQQRKSQLQN